MTSFAFAPGAVNAHLNRSILNGFKGVCYLRLHYFDKARALFEQDLAATDAERSIHNAIVRVDLATVYGRMGEIEAACHYAGEALEIMVQLRSPQVFQRVLAFRETLKSSRKARSIKVLDEELADLAPHMTRSRGLDE